MSSLATAALFPVDSLALLVSAAKPKRGLLGTKDEFPATRARLGASLPSFEASGIALVTVLSFLQEQGIDLIRGAYDNAADSLSKARNASFFILTTAHAEQAVPPLDAAAFSPGELEQYYEELHEDSAPGAGTAMAAGIRYLRSLLQELRHGQCVVLEVG